MPDSALSSLTVENVLAANRMAISCRLPVRCVKRGLQGEEQRKVLGHLSSEGKKALQDLQRNHIDAPPGVALKASLCTSNMQMDRCCKGQRSDATRLEQAAWPFRP